MIQTHELLRNGPRLRVTLPDILPPDWDGLESDLELELQEGVVQRATIVAPRCAPARLTVDAVLRIASLLGREGVRVRIEPDDARRTCAAEDVVDRDEEETMGTMEFTRGEARAIGERIGIDWAAGDVDLEQFRTGLAIELEHGTQDPATDVTHDDETVTGKIALAHLKEIPDYYTRLAVMEREAER